ncbi:MAG: NAD(P)H-hydrate dehydratase [Candidatus Omnitrophota bacterium]|nr:NAD(P)H-hydrate dehydratase [Candidatus Omnitrophota bacterium]
MKIPSDIRKLLPKRRPDTHKGDYGHVFVIAGSVGMTGAATLTSMGALLSGSGLVTLGIPKSLNPILEVKLTEVMTKPLPETDDQTLSEGAFSKILKFAEKANCVAIGPGLSRNFSTEKLVKELVVSLDKPMVLDADGINALEGEASILNSAKAPIVITPHPGEMARLVSLSRDAIVKVKEKVAKNFANKYNVVCVLKGHRTVVADPKGKIYVNLTGNPGMASGGVGDVLTGMIASFIGQGIKPFDAARLGVFLHGLAGDLAAREKGEVSLIASDLLNKLPEAIKLLA